MGEFQKFAKPSLAFYAEFLHVGVVLFSYHTQRDDDNILQFVPDVPVGHSPWLPYYCDFLL